MGIPRPIYKKICIECRGKTKGYSKKCHACSLRIGGKNKGENNGAWMGNDICYFGLHAWVKKYRKQKDACEKCGKEGNLDLANTGIYDRNFKNWKDLCRRCHMISDGRLLNLAKNARKAGNALKKKKGMGYYKYLNDIRWHGKKYQTV